MSDIGLTGIAGLEAEMRDRLKAKDAEIERLRASNAELELKIHATEQEALQEIAKRDASNAALLGALEPFAKLADRKELDQSVADDAFPLNIGLMNGSVTQSVIRGALAVADVRKARTAVANAKAE